MGKRKSQHKHSSDDKPDKRVKRKKEGKEGKERKKKDKKDKKDKKAKQAPVQDVADDVADAVRAEDAAYAALEAAQHARGEAASAHLAAQAAHAAADERARSALIPLHATTKAMYDQAAAEAITGYCEDDESDDDAFTEHERALETWFNAFDDAQHAICELPHTQAALYRAEARVVDCSAAYRAAASARLQAVAAGEGAGEDDDRGNQHDTLVFEPSTTRSKQPLEGSARASTGTKVANSPNASDKDASRKDTPPHMSPPTSPATPETPTPPAPKRVRPPRGRNSKKAPMPA